MTEDSHTFTGRFGTLKVDQKGITIQRNWRQAVQNGRLLPRTQTIPFSNLKDVQQSRRMFNRNELKFIQNAGAPGITPLNRRTSVAFDPRQSHQFRQAKQIIDAKLREVRGES